MILLLGVVSGLLAGGCAGAAASRTRDQSGHDMLVGAWRGRVQFRAGPFAAVKDLEFMYVFNAGGTMTESSNYDASPPVPPPTVCGERSIQGSSRPSTHFMLRKLPRVLRTSPKVAAGHQRATECLSRKSRFPRMESLSNRQSVTMRSTKRASSPKAAVRLRHRLSVSV